MKMRTAVEIWLKSLIDDFTLGGLHSAMGPHQAGRGSRGAGSENLCCLNMEPKKLCPFCVCVYINKKEKTAGV